MTLSPSPNRAITIHERITEEGALERTLLTRGDGGEEGPLRIVVGEVSLPLPDGALLAVMRRYGKPLALDFIEPEASLDVGDVASGPMRLVRFRHLARYDVIAKDFLALYQDGKEPICELAASVCAALLHLARASARHAAAAKERGEL